MLLRNDLLTYGGTRPRTVRILWIDSGKTVAYTFELDAKGAQPELASFPSLVADVQQRRAQLQLIDPYRVRADTAALPPRHLELQARAWQIVTALTQHQPAIYQARNRGRMIQACSEQHSVSHPSIYRYLRRYWERGQDADALLPDYGNSGAPGKSRGSRANVKRGRPRKSGAAGANADLAIRDTFRAAVARYAATHTQFSRHGAYWQMIEDYFDANDDNALPTFGQFKYWIEKDRLAAP